jgi:hypothetical protein
MQPRGVAHYDGSLGRCTLTEEEEPGQSSTQTRGTESSPASRRKRTAGLDANTTGNRQIKQPGAPVDVERIEPWKHVVVWLVGVVIASLIPFLWIFGSANPKNPSPGAYQLLGKGDLYLISVVVLIAGVTEIALLLRKIQHDMTMALLIIGGFLFIMFDAARYAGASSLVGTLQPSPPSVTYWSLAAFAISAIHSSICVGLAAGAR